MKILEWFAVVGCVSVSGCFGVAESYRYKNKFLAPFYVVWVYLYIYLTLTFIEFDCTN